MYIFSNAMCGYISYPDYKFPGGETPGKKCVDVKDSGCFSEYYQYCELIFDDLATKDDGDLIKLVERTHGGNGREEFGDFEVIEPKKVLL